MRGTNNPYLPTNFTDRNLEKSSVAYDNDGVFVGHLATVTNTRGDVRSYAYDYSQSPLGDLSTVQESYPGGTLPNQSTPTPATSLQQSSFTYYPNGQLETATTPAPDTTTADPATVLTTYTYTSLGDVLSVDAPVGRSFLGLCVRRHAPRTAGRCRGARSLRQ